jgi:hypothetical protein
VTLLSNCHAKSRQFWLAWLCAVCMLGFQGLGQVHRVIHSKAVVSIAPSIGHPVFASESSAGWGHQSGDAVCLLLDQLGADQMPATEPSALTHADLACDGASTRALRVDTAQHWKRGARGPPVFA